MAKSKSPQNTDQETKQDDATPSGGSLSHLPRVVSLLVLIAVVLFVAVLFFRVMASFLVPLFLAAVLAVIFKPVHEWFVRKLPGRRRLAALGVTALVGLMVVIPTAYFGWKAFAETKVVVAALADEENRKEIVGKLGEQFAPAEKWIHENLDRDFDLKDTGVGLLGEAVGGVVGLGLLSLRAAIAAGIGLTIMIVALYYFFADGPGMIETLMHLSPMDDAYERELLDQFSNVSRAVVLATLLSAIVQGLLGGVGYAVAFAWAQPAAEAAGEAAQQSHAAPIFLLTVLTTLLAIVPFLGATAVWVPVSLWLMFVTPDGFWPGVGLAVYGFTIVSSIDNVIKPYVLHGQSNLHPLLALLSVLGGIQLLGPVGILVGPMLVAFLQALLQMLRKELDELNDSSPANGGSGVSEDQS